MRFKDLGEVAAKDGSNADPGDQDQLPVIALEITPFPTVIGCWSWLRKIVGTALGMILIVAAGFGREAVKQDQNALNTEASPVEAAPQTRTSTPQKPKKPLALLRIESTPSNANIVINNKREPLRTPAEFTLLPGDYNVVLSLDCHTSASTTLHLVGDDKQILRRELQSLPAGLAVRTLPPGARIIVDGALRNERTPATITDIDAGDRSVTVELAGYRSQKMAVKLKCGETATVDFGALQRPTGTLAISSNVEAASVWLDGVDSGQKTPCSLDLPLGAHKVRLIGPRGYRPEEKSFTVQDEESMRLYVPLTAESTTTSANDTAASQRLGQSHD